jgi:hypothetical protein
MSRVAATEMRIDFQGAIDVNYAIVVSKGDKIALLEIDLKSKRAEIVAHGESDAPLLTLRANDETLRLNPAYTKDDMTQISFPAFAGWEVFCCDASRYTIRLALKKLGIRT